MVKTNKFGLRQERRLDLFYETGTGMHLVVRGGCMYALHPHGFNMGAGIIMTVSTTKMKLRSAVLARTHITPMPACLPAYATDPHVCLPMRPTRMPCLTASGLWSTRWIA